MSSCWQDRVFLSTGPTWKRKQSSRYRHKQEPRTFERVRERERISWCFTPSQPVRLYQGEERKRVNRSKDIYGYMRAYLLQDENYHGKPTRERKINAFKGWKGGRSLVSLELKTWPTAQEATAFISGWHERGSTKLVAPLKDSLWFRH